MAVSLVQRGKQWHCRIRYPGGVQVWKALKTVHQEEAAVRSAYLAATVTALSFELKLLPTEELLMRIKARLDAIVQQWVNSQLEATEDAKADCKGFDDEYSEAQKDVYYDLLETAHEALIGNQQWQVTGLADELMARHGLVLERESLEYKQLCRGLLVGKVNMLQEELRRMDGEYREEPSIVSPIAPVVVLSDGPSVKAAFDKYMEASRYRRKHTQGQVIGTVQAFLNHAQLLWTSPLDSITKAQCVSYKDAEVANGMKSATVNRKLSYLGHFFKWCEGRDYLKANPTSRLRVTGRAQAEDRMIRIGFTLTQMHAIREALEAKRRTQPELYWVSLVAMYTGMRVGEVWTLYCDRLQSERGIDFIDLREDRPRNVRLKNKNATRKVVLHSGLLKAGFLNYVEDTRQKAGDTAQLFPAIGSTSPVSRFFQRVCAGINIQQRDLSLHSCRHFQASEMVKQNVQTEVRHYHLGHGLAGSVQNSVYVHLDFPLETLREAVERVAF